MAANRIDVTLEDEALVEFVRGKVQSGEYASADDVVRDTMRAVLEENKERERWEREVLLPAHHRLMADPSSAVSFEQVQQGLEAKRNERLKAS